MMRLKIGGQIIWGGHHVHQTGLLGLFTQETENRKRHSQKTKKERWVHAWAWAWA